MLAPKLVENPEFGKVDDAPKLIANPEHVDAHTGRSVIDSVKWRLSKLRPKVYGDRLELAGKVGTATDLVDQAPDWLKEAIKDKTAEVAAAQGDGDGTAPEGKTVH